MAWRIKLGFFLLLTTISAFSQGVRIDSVAQSTTGIGGVQVVTPVANPTVTICTSGASGIPCFPQAQTFTDATLVTPCAANNQVTLTGTSVCSSTGDAKGNYGFWVAPGTYKFTITGAGLTGQLYNLVAPIPGGSPTFTNITATGTVTAGQINSRIYVDGVKYPLTPAGIQQAFTDACAIAAPGDVNNIGTTVYLPPMEVVFTGTGSQEILLTCAVNIVGAGEERTWFVFGGAVPSTTPMFRIQPNNVASQEFGEFSGFSVVGATSGGDAFVLDGTLAGITGPNNWTFSHIRTTGLSTGAWSINSTCAGGATQQGWNHIFDNTFGHGIKMTTTCTADNWLIDHNNFNFANMTTPCVDASTLIGAANIFVEHNHGGCAGGFFISHGTTQCKVNFNQIQLNNANSEANSALIDLIGDTYNIDGCEIRGNNINGFTFTTNAIRVAGASNTLVEHNVIQVKPTTGVGILLTGTATNVIARDNECLNLSGGAVCTSNVGGNTTSGVRSQFGGSTFSAAHGFDVNVGSNGPISGLNLIGNQLVFLNAGINDCSFVNGTQLTCINTLAYAWAPSDPTGVAADTGLSRAAPALIYAGNGTAGNKAALFQSGNTKQLTSDFTDANASGLQVITGLSFALPAFASNYSFHCGIQYSQATPSASDQFGVASLTTAPTQLRAWAKVVTTEGAGAVLNTADSGAITTTTPTAIVTFTPVGAGIKQVDIDGSLEVAGGGASTLQFYVTNGTAANVIVIKRDSYCQVW